LNRPSLFLIGAMKSGTTTLHELLARHPQLAMCEPKEPCYFIDPKTLASVWPEMWRKGFWKEEAAYLSLFPAKPGAQVLGESSTDYSKRPLIDGVVERIAAYSPQPRFVYIMRDPVERTISHYWHMVELRGELRAPLDAIVQEPHYTDVSHYAFQLAPYIERFGSSSVLALTFEALKSDPQAVVAEVCRWLGLDPDAAPAEPVEAQNVTPEEVRQKRAGMGLLERVRYSAAWSAAGRYVPAPLRKVGVAMVEKKVARREVPMDAVIAHLRPLQQAQTIALQTQLGRRFEEWTTLWGDATR
jgi:Sulfotransferase family